MPASDNQSEIQALVSMMDDPDPVIYKEVSGKILHYGDDAVPFLEEELMKVKEQASRNRLEQMMKQIHLENISRGLTGWLAASPEEDLLDGWLRVTRYRYPNLDESVVRENIEMLRRDIWLEINDNLTALERIKVFNHVFYDTHGFSGNMDDYHNPDNSYVNRVLETRMGNPLSLGILYMLLAREMNMPVVGINLPEHFVLAYMGESLDPQSLQVQYDKPLFYINAFSGGAVFSEMEINEFLDKLKFEPIPSFFEPCPHKQILLRMLNNLVMAYDLQESPKRKQELENLRNRFEKLL